jgi:hypothetical protein
VQLLLFVWCFRKVAEEHKLLPGLDDLSVYIYFWNRLPLVLDVVCHVGVLYTSKNAHFLASDYQVAT